MTRLRTKRRRRVERLAVVQHPKHEPPLPVSGQRIAYKHDVLRPAVLYRVRRRLLHDAEKVGEARARQVVRQPPEAAPRVDLAAVQVPHHLAEHVLGPAVEHLVAAQVEYRRSDLGLRVRQDGRRALHRLLDGRRDFRSDRERAFHEHLGPREVLLYRVVQVRGHSLALGGYRGDSAALALVAYDADDANGDKRRKDRSDDKRRSVEDASVHAPAPFYVWNELYVRLGRGRE